MSTITYTCSCGNDETIPAADATIILTLGSKVLITRCITDNQVCRTILNESTFQLLLTSTVLLDPSVRDLLASKVNR